MSLLRQKGTKQTSRASVLIKLRVIDKGGFPIDEQAVWDALVALMEKHPYYRVEAAEIRPDIDGEKIS